MSLWRAMGLLFLLGVVAAALGLAGCSKECSQAARCEGNILITCHTGGDMLPHDYEEREDCAAEGMQCVQTETAVACALPDPACSEGSYCKGDTAIHCSDELPGYSREPRSCAPYACIQADGGKPICVDGAGPCFEQPDGQYCEDYSTSAYECWQSALIRSTGMCSYCYINADGVAASQDTKVPCL